MLPVTSLAYLLTNSKSSGYIAGTELYEHLARLTDSMKGVPGWRMRVTNERRRAFDYQGKAAVIGRFVVDYISFTTRTGNGHSKNRRQVTKRFDVLNLERFMSPVPETLEGQYQMVMAIFELCNRRGIKPKSSRGAIATALFKKSPLWEKGRKPAPRFVNVKSREELPGNFYSVSSKVRTIPFIDHCYYVDQTSAHHTVASSIPIPHPSSIRARGDYRRILAGGLPGRWLTYQTPSYTDFVESHSGLIYVKVHVSTLPPTKRHLYPPWAQKAGSRFVWLWTPELRLIAGDHRVQIEYLACGFTGTENDPVVKEYAKWSLANRNKYTKSILLAAYGMLAWNPFTVPLYRYWTGTEPSKGRPVHIPIAGDARETKVCLPEFCQSVMSNVIARGLIEAETRTRTIEYARDLDNQGLHVAQLYADGIMVEADQMPFIPNGWRISHSLTGVHFPRTNAFISDQLTKLPGVSLQEERRYRAARPHQVKVTRARATTIA